MKNYLLNKPLLAAGAVAISMAVSGCASQRISGALEGYGVPPENAQCVGDSLSERLSISQLESLSRAAKAYRSIDRSSIPLTLIDLTRVAAELRDPVIPIEIVRAGVKCSVLPAGSKPAV